MKIDVPKYQQIAADIAAKIAYGDYTEGQKIHVRSSLATQYGVSSETARRAVSLLADMKIVDVSKGSGVLIISQNKAADFIGKFNSVSRMSELKNQIMRILNNQIEQSTEMKSMLSDLIYKTERFRNINPFTPFDIEITDKASVVGKSISEAKFWHNTTATVIAIRREEQIIISPGPYAIITVGDVLYYIGDENCHERVRNFLYMTN